MVELVPCRGTLLPLRRQLGFQPRNIEPGGQASPLPLSNRSK